MLRKAKIVLHIITLVGLLSLFAPALVVYAGAGSVYADCEGWSLSLQNLTDGKLNRTWQLFLDGELVESDTVVLSPGGTAFIQGDWGERDLSYILHDVTLKYVEQPGDEWSTRFGPCAAPPPKTLTLDPESALNKLPTDTEHTFTATVVDMLGGSAVGVTVSFATDFGTFQSGGQYTEVTTDGYGEASVTVVSEVPGTAEIRAWIDDGDDVYGKGELTDISTKTWEEAGPTELDVYKSVAVEWARAYDWTIVKSVEPDALELLPGEDGDIVYTLDVTRSPAGDVYTVYGTITAQNDVENPAHILSVKDAVEYRLSEADPWSELTRVDVAGASWIPQGAQDSWDYEFSFTPVEGATYRNVAYVTLENYIDGEHTFSYAVPFDPPAIPDSEQDACATVTDVQDIPEGFSATDDYPVGGWDTCESATYMVNKTVTNDSAGPGTYDLDNTATVVEEDTQEEDEDDATVVITVPEPEPTTLTLDPDEATNVLPTDTEHTFTATVVDQYGDPVEGVMVSFSTDFGTFQANDSSYVEVTTDANGEASVVIVSITAGTAEIRAWIDDGDDAYAEGELTDDPSAKIWEGEGPTSLDVSKTVEVEWVRIYDWSVEKTVEPDALELLPGEDGEVVYTIDVTRSSAGDTYTVYGTITAQNDIENAAHILSVEDVLEYRMTGPGGEWAELTSMIVDGESWIPAGDVGEWDYGFSFTPVEGATYRNVAYVTLANHPDGEHVFLYRESFDLPVTPDSEEDACATVTDVQEIPEGFSATDDYPVGGWDTCESATYTVNKTVTNDNAGPGTYDLDNTATVVEEDTQEEDEDDATVVITVPEPEPTTLTLDPDEATNALPTDTEHTFTATVLDQYGDPVEGVMVSFSTDFGTFQANDSSYVEITTDANGEASVVIVSITAGTAEIRAWIDDGDDAYAEGELTDDPSAKIWEGEGPTSLDVSKTVEVEWERIYDWSVEKTVEPDALELLPGEDGEVVYTIDVTRSPAGDTYTVYGTITAQNDVENAAHILSVEDVIEYRLTGPGGEWTELASMIVDGESWIPAGDVGEWDYGLSFTPVEGATYRNVVYVTLANHPDGEHVFLYRESFDLPATPSSEQDACATVTDVQDIPTGFSATDDYPEDGWDTCESDSFTVNKTVTNDSADTGTYDLDNTATVTPEDSGDAVEDQATVTLTVPEAGPACIELTKHIYGPYRTADNLLLDDRIIPVAVMQVAGNDENLFYFLVEITVNNCGGAPLTNVVVEDTFSNEAQPFETDDPSNVIISPPPDPNNGMVHEDLTWTVGTIPVGQGRTLNVKVGTEFNPSGRLEPTSAPQTIYYNGRDNSTGSASVTADGGLSASVGAMQITNGEEISCENTDGEWDNLDWQTGGGTVSPHNKCAQITTVLPFMQSSSNPSGAINRAVEYQVFLPFALD